MIVVLTLIHLTSIPAIKYWLTSSISNKKYFTRNENKRNVFVIWSTKVSL